MAESKANLHMTHVDNVVLYNGIEDTENWLEIFSAVPEGFKNFRPPESIDVSVKWDGAPAVFFGPLPKKYVSKTKAKKIVDFPEEDHGKFFVASKGLFNAKSKYFTSIEEIDADEKMPNGLKSKLKSAYLSLKDSYKGTDIVQGDFLFGPGDVKDMEINGNPMVGFSQNTLMYAVDADSKQAEDLKTKEVGIAVHTTYPVKEDMLASSSSGVNMDDFGESSKLWLEDPMLSFEPDMVDEKLRANLPFNEKELSAYSKSLSQAKNLYSQAKPFIQVLQENPKLATRLEAFQNSVIRSGDLYGNIRKGMSGVMKDLGEYVEKMEPKLLPLIQQNAKGIAALFLLQTAMVDLKIMVINKLSSVSRFAKFVQKSDGSFEVRGDEGFVFINRQTGSVTKFVDRVGFSRDNWSPDVIKGWQVKSESIEENLENNENTVIIYPGRFQPAGRHHVEVFNALKRKFPKAKHFIGTTGKVEPGSPFNFDQKREIFVQLGLKPDEVIEAKRGTYNLASYGEVAGPNDYLVFAIGQKDMEEDPRFQFTPGELNRKKSGDPAAIQLYGNENPPKPSSERAYIFAMPNVETAGEVASASAFRKAFIAADENGKRELMARFGYPDGLYDLFAQEITREKALKLAHAGYMGTIELVRNYKKATPGQTEQLKKLLEKLNRAYGGKLSKSTKAKRAAQFKKQAEKPDDDPSAYKKAPGDFRTKTKVSKHTKKFKDMYGEEIKCWDGYRRVPGKRPGTKGSCKKIGEEVIVEISAAAEKSLKAKSKKTGIPYGILKQVFNRGMAAWKTGHRPGAGQVQWAHARVNSFATKSKGTWGGADKDLAAKARKSMKKKNEALQLIEKAKHYMDGMSKEKQCKIRIVKTTKPEHKKDGKNWRIRGKRRPEVTLGLYKTKPSIKTCVDRLKNVAGHEYGKG